MKSKFFHSSSRSLFDVYFSRSLPRVIYTFNVLNSLLYASSSALSSKSFHFLFCFANSFFHCRRSQNNNQSSQHDSNETINKWMMMRWRYIGLYVIFSIFTMTQKIAAHHSSHSIKNIFFCILLHFWILVEQQTKQTQVSSLLITCLRCCSSCCIINWERIYLNSTHKRF